MHKKIFEYLGVIAILFFGFLSKPSHASMVQRQNVIFPEIGMVEIQAQTIDEKFPSIKIFDSTKKLIFKLELGHSDESFKHSAGIEFIVYHINGLPDPLLAVVSAGPHGSDTAWEVALIGVLSGKIDVLWKQPKELWSEGGFFIGNIGEKGGIGIAIWNVIWESGCHRCPHNYSLQLFPWDKEKLQFILGSNLLTKNKYSDCSGEPLKELGFDFKDLRIDFKRLKDFW